MYLGYRVEAVLVLPVVGVIVLIVGVFYNPKSNRNICSLVASTNRYTRTKRKNEMAQLYQR
ncbi:MAG: hypothetical protein ACQCN6_06115 [Candidatus Bathyarchaeia archaeon]|jgi:hypothetical protein